VAEPNLGPFSFVVFLDECVGGRHLCSCPDGHKIDDRAQVIAEKAPRGLSDRQVILFFFRMIRRGGIPKTPGVVTKFVFLTKDKRFILAVGREERATKSRHHGLKADSEKECIRQNNISIHVCRVSKTSCPIQRFNKFISFFGGS